MAAAVAGCAPRATQHRQQVSSEIERRVGHGLPPAQAAMPAIPPGVTLADGLSEEEAVAVALWNNAAFRLELSALGFARADLLEAGLLKNPVLSLLFPWGPKQMELTASWPLEALWQRPRRIAVARLNLERTAQNLVQHGLNLARDARVAYADAVLSEARARYSGEERQLAQRIAGLAEARLRAGDISELEAETARAEVRAVEEQVIASARDAAVASTRLRSTLGLGADDGSFMVAPSAADTAGPGELPQLLKSAWAARPDARAAELAMEAAAARAGLERAQILSLSGIVDANSAGREGFEIGPGIGLPLPLFDRNPAGRARARAEVERAALHYAAVRQQIAREVQEAHARLVQTREALALLRNNILPSLEANVRRSESAFAAGEVSYLPVLENTRRFVEARLREAEVAADLRRARAELERSAGNRTARTP